MPIIGAAMCQLTHVIYGLLKNNTPLIRISHSKTLDRQDGVYALGALYFRHIKCVITMALYQNRLPNAALNTCYHPSVSPHEWLPSGD